MRKKKFQRTIKNSKKIGSIKIPPKPPFPEKHELMTASFLSNRGYDIEFISPSQIKGSRTPDIIMSNLYWEMKSPISDGKRSIEHNIRDALRQSENIILDLRRLKISTEKALSKINNEIQKTKKIKRFLVIIKSEELLDLKQNFVNIKI
jgi:hypothetical protein